MQHNHQCIGDDSVDPTTRGHMGGGVVAQGGDIAAALLLKVDMWYSMTSVMVAEWIAHNRLIKPCMFEVIQQ